jgi:hypothetical protein
MNTIKRNKNNIKRLILSLGMMIASFSYAQDSSDAVLATKIGKTFGSFANAIHTSLTGFFDGNSSVPYKDCVERINDDEKKYRNACQSFEPNGSLSKRMCDLFQEALDVFSKPAGVIKRYAGQSSNSVLSFIGEMKKAFDPEAAFNAILAKLKSLYKDAQVAKETDLTDLISKLIKTLEVKKAEWNNKKSHTLLSGLTRRMSLQ